jgi:poly-gamma-glutamate synthesis protein (capsule biosynthesis protein)
MRVSRYTWYTIVAVGILVGVFVLPRALSHITFLKTPSKTTVLFVGDMMFDRTIRTRIEQYGADHVLSCVAETLQGVDMVVGNLEGPITSNPSVSVGTVPGDPSNMQFTFDPSVTAALKKYNIQAVSLANNHMFDFGRSGVMETKKYLTNAGIGFFGDPTDDTHKTLVEKNIAFVGFNQFLGVDSVLVTEKEIRAQKEKGYAVVVFAHWGEEYVAANNYQKQQARAFIDAGADLVVGAHPHVVQESEIYNGKYIYYSLGNFIFDQWWNEDVRTGMGVLLAIEGESLSTQTINFESGRDGRICPL